jgi:transposase-like protein
MVITKRDEDFLRGLKATARWSASDARRVLGLHEQSGESRAAFARRHGLHPERLAWWKRRFAELDAGAAGPDTGSRAGFVELVPPSSGNVPAARLRVGRVEVELRTLDVAAARFVAALAHHVQDGACS